MTKYLKKDGMGKPRICAQCRRGYDGNDDPTVGPAEAEYYVRGTVWDGSGERRAPYHGYLCEAHLDMMQTDGAEFKEITEIGAKKDKPITIKKTNSPKKIDPKKGVIENEHKNETPQEWYERLLKKNRERQEAEREKNPILCGKTLK